MKSERLWFLLGLAFPLSLWLVAGEGQGPCAQTTPAESPCECGADASQHGKFRDAAPTAAHWWLPEDHPVPFEILGKDDRRLISAVPYSPDDEFPILLRVGTRAQRSGDSRTLGYFSEEIHDPGDKESQALYGINKYSGSSTASQLGVHGMALSVPGAGQSMAAIVGAQGFATHMDRKGGLTRNVLGLSGVGQTGKGKEVNGTVHNLVGVYAHSQSRGATDVIQALSIHARAPEISGSGPVKVAAAGRFDQPSGASDENHAILLGGTHDDPSIGFMPAGGAEAARSIAWSERHGSFEFSHGVRLPVHTSADRPAPGVPGKLIFNTDHGNLNIDTGARWILPNGKPAK